MQKKILALILSLTLILTLVPSVFVLAYTVESAAEVVIYDNDFEEAHWFSSGATGAALALIGGWDKSGNGDFQTRVGGSGYGFVPGSAPGIADMKKNTTNGSSEYYIPQWARFNTGIYTYIFDYYRGSKTNQNYLGFNDSTTWDSNTTENLFELSYAMSDAGGNFDQGSWHKLKIEFDMDNDVATITAYDINGTLRGSKTAEWTRDYLTYISFRTWGSNNIAASSNQPGYATMIDNFSVTWKPASTKKILNGNVYANDFDNGVPLNTNPEYYTEGGWLLGTTNKTEDLDEYGCYDRSGITAGRYEASTGFAPAFSPSVNSIIRQEWNGSAYFLPPDKMMDSGTYTVNFDFKLGTKLFDSVVYLYPAHDLSDETNEVGINLRYNPVNAANNTWYNFDLTVDIDNHSYTVNVYNGDGALFVTSGGSYPGGSLGAIQFYIRGANSTASSANNDVAFSTAIDNFEINYTGSGSPAIIEPEDPAEPIEVSYSFDNDQFITLPDVCETDREKTVVMPDNSKYAYVRLTTPAGETDPSEIYTTWDIRGEDEYGNPLTGTDGSMGGNSEWQTKVPMDPMTSNGSYIVPIKNENGTLIFKYDKKDYAIKFTAVQPRITVLNDYTDNENSKKVVYVGGAAANNDNGTLTESSSMGNNAQYIRGLGNISPALIGSSIFMVPQLADKTSGTLFSFKADHGGKIVVMNDTEIANSDYDSWELENDGVQEDAGIISGSRVVKSRTVNNYTNVGDYYAISIVWWCQGNYGGRDQLNSFRTTDPGLNNPTRSNTSAPSSATDTTKSTRGAYGMCYSYSKNFEAGELVEVPAYGNTSRDNAVFVIWDVDIETGTTWKSAEVVSGTGANEDYFTINAKAKTELEEVPANAKMYFAIYAKDGKLLDSDLCDYESSVEVESKNFRKSYNGVAPAYAKIFIWSGLTPLTLPKKIIINDNFDNEGLKVLAIGNSFSQDSVSTIKDIAAADGVKINATNAYLAGRNLKGHYDAWNGDTTYRMQPNGSHTDTYMTLQQFVEMDDWDYITLQGTTHYAEYDAGLWNVNSANTTNYWTTLKNGISSLAPDAKRLVHATWAPINELSGRVNDGMFENGTPDARGAYLTALLPNEQIGADIFSTEERTDGENAYIPTAVAVDYLIRRYRFAEYNGELDETSEYDNSGNTRAVYRDKTCHLTYNVGRVLAGLVWYEMLTGFSATENKYQRSTLSEADMAKLKEAAHYACQNYATYDPSSVTPIETDAIPAQVMKVKNGADATIVFVHDDGSKGVAEYLGTEFEKNNLNGTVAIIGKNITTQADADDWTEIFDEAHGRINFASHSYYHEYMGQTDEEHTNYFSGVAKVYPAGYMTQTIANERARLNSFFPNERILAFVKPGVTKPDGITTQLSTEARAMIREHYIAMRDTGGGVDTIPPENQYQVKSLMAKVGECELADWQSNLTQAINKKGMLVYLFHGIENTASNLTSAKSDVSVLLAQLGEKVAQGKIWSAKFDEAMQYAMEYGSNAAADATVYYNDQHISVSVTDEISKLDPDLSGRFANREMFDYPLTVKVEVPFNWNYVKLTQSYDRRTEIDKTFVENGVRYVYANVVPDQGAATLVEASSNDYVSTLSAGESAVSGFDPATFYYKVTLPSGTTSAPSLSCEKSSAVITQATLTDGEGSAFIEYSGLKYEVHFSVE